MIWYLFVAAIKYENMFLGNRNVEMGQYAMKFLKQFTTSFVEFLIM